MNSGGDVLARGGHSAQFAAGGSNLTDFEADFIFKDVTYVIEKYGLSQEEYDQYSAMRLKDERLPDLKTVALQEELGVGFSISDRRKDYLSTAEVKPVEPKDLKFPVPTYDPMETLLDRILVMVISDDPNIELMEDGSTRNKTTGLITASKYRQHSNVGIVLLGGQWVITAGVKTPMVEILKPGDKVIYGDYGSEKVPMSDAKAESLCDSIYVNYEKTEQGLRVVRIQDVRIVERRAALCKDNPETCEVPNV